MHLTFLGGRGGVHAWQQTLFLCLLSCTSFSFKTSLKTDPFSVSAKVCCFFPIWIDLESIYCSCCSHSVFCISKCICLFTGWTLQTNDKNPECWHRGSGSQGWRCKSAFWSFPSNCSSLFRVGRGGRPKQLFLISVRSLETSETTMDSDDFISSTWCFHTLPYFLLIMQHWYMH